MGSVARVLGLLTASLIALPASAVADPPFTPREYVRTTGGPNIFTARFPACGLDREFRLILENGPDRRPRVSSGTVTLNGVELVNERDLNQQVARIERLTALKAHNDLVVRLAGKPGEAVRVNLDPIPLCLEVAITEPPPGATVPAEPLLVRGTVRGGPEIGVTVNGLPAALDGTAFAALVPVDTQSTALVAVATTPDGAVAEDRRPLAVAPGARPPLLFTPTPASGAAPLSVRFTLSSLIPLATVSLDLEADGSVDFEGLDLDDHEFIYTDAGVYTPTLTVVDLDGGAYTVTGIVQASDPAALDRLLQSKWAEMKGDLRRGNIGSAVRFIARSARSDYEELLTALSSQLGQIDAILGDLSLVSIDWDRAEYEMLRHDDGVEVSHYVLFVREGDGIWRVKFF
jgi:hypothetical protein